MTDSAKLPEREYRGETGYDHFITAHTFLGQAQIELIQLTTDDPSICREVLDKKGEALHHVQLNCGVLDAAGFEKRVQHYREMGLDLVHSLTLPNVARIVYFDALELMGFFIELAERPPFLYQNVLRMYEAHIGWDGANPIRENAFADLAKGG